MEQAVTRNGNIPDRRAEIRVEASDVIRWKRPGQLEDNKAWTIDRSSNGIGFLTASEAAPAVGDVITLRRLDQDRWSIIEGAVEIARVSPCPRDELTVVGCRLR